jgi:hypothetical protein
MLSLKVASPNPTEPAAAAAKEGSQQGKIIKNENIDDSDDEIEIIEETKMKTTDTGVGVS